MREEKHGGGAWVLVVTVQGEVKDLGLLILFCIFTSRLGQATSEWRDLGLVHDRINARLLVRVIALRLVVRVTRRRRLRVSHGRILQESTKTRTHISHVTKTRSNCSFMMFRLRAKVSHDEFVGGQQLRSQSGPQEAR